MPRPAGAHRPWPDLRAAAPAADPGVHVRDGKQLQRHKLDIIGGDMLDLIQLDEGFE